MPIDLEWNVDGIPEVKAFLKDITNVEWKRRAMTKSTLVAQAGMSKYPPPRTFRQVTKRSSLFSRGSRAVAGRSGRFWASSYRRTGTLGRSWTAKVSHTGDGDVTGHVGTRVKYAPWVQSARFQAWMHQGRWQTDRMVLEENLPKFAAFFREELRKEVRKGRP